MPHTVRVQIDGGDAGIFQTLALMSKLISEGIDTPAVVDVARWLAVQGGVRRPYFQALAIQSWLKRVWRFVYDPADRELLLSADALLQRFDRFGFIAGDCDEAAILGAALGRAIGLDAQLVVYHFDTGEAHVFAVLLTDAGEAISLDVTRPAGPLPTPTRAVAIDV